MKFRTLPSLLFLGVWATTAAPQAPNPQAQSAPSPASAQGTTGKTLTLQQAEAIALQKNPQITVGKLKALQAQEFVRETRSAFYPTANLSITAVESRPGSRVAAGYLNNPIIYPRAATGASVTQLITDFGRTQNLLSSSKFLAQAEDENAVATRQQIILAVDQAFYNSIETQALLQVAQQTVHARQLLVDQVQALTDAKLKSDLDLSFSKVDLSRAKLLLLDSQNNFAASLSSLSAILGYTDRQKFLPVEPPPQNAPPALDVAPLIQQALQQRPEVKALQDEVASASKFSRAEHDLWRPTVTAAGLVGLAPVRDPHIDNWYGAAGININIPVFNGFLFNARAKTADLETQAKQQRLLDLQNSVARDVRNSWLDTQKAYERLSLTQQLREQANLALELAQARYKLGLGSIVEFSQAELQKTEADLQDTDAHYQYVLAQILLAYQMGLSR
jgi:outer membrane protein